MIVLSSGTLSINFFFLVGLHIRKGGWQFRKNIMGKYIELALYFGERVQSSTPLGCATRVKKKEVRVIMEMVFKEKKKTRKIENNWLYRIKYMKIASMCEDVQEVIEARMVDPK